MNIAFQLVYLYLNFAYQFTKLLNNSILLSEKKVWKRINSSTKGQVDIGFLRINVSHNFNYSFCPLHAFILSHLSCGYSCQSIDWFKFKL